MTHQEITVHEITLRLRDLPLQHRADLLAEQLNELCLELNIELCISCDAPVIYIHERTDDVLACVESFQGQPWITFDDGELSL